MFFFFREVDGEYVGVDATLVKMELSEVSKNEKLKTLKKTKQLQPTFPQISLLEGNRKVSRV